MFHPLQTKGKSTGCDPLRRWCWPWSFAKQFHQLSFFHRSSVFCIYHYILCYFIDRKYSKVLWSVIQMQNARIEMQAIPEFIVGGEYEHVGLRVCKVLLAGGSSNNRQKTWMMYLPLPNPHGMSHRHIYCNKNCFKQNAWIWRDYDCAIYPRLTPSVMRRVL